MVVEGENGTNKTGLGLVIIGVVLLLVVAVAAVRCRPDPVGPPTDCDSPNPTNCAIMKTPYMNGVWKLAAFRASGYWTPGAEKEAAAFLGRNVTIDGTSVKLPNGAKCQIVSAGPSVVRDNVETFGSASGSWAKMGLTPIPDDEKVYKVIEMNFACGEMFWGIVMQPEQDIYLLKVWEVYLLMKKTGDSS